MTGPESTDPPHGACRPGSDVPLDADFDAGAVLGLDHIELGWRYKATPVTAAGLTIDAVIRSRPILAHLPTPMLTLNAAAMRHNQDVLTAWCADRGVLLAPHGKTTMAPQLWAQQVRRGAWGITLATWAQLRVARAFGFHPLQLANSLTDPRAVEWVANQGGARIVSWVDSVETVEIIQQTLTARAHPRSLEVLIELGAAGGRTGAPDVAAAVEVAKAAAAADRVRVVGVAGYEGAVAHSASASDVARVRSFLADLTEVHRRLLAAGLYADGDLMVTAGGSAYFDVVGEMLAPLAAEAASRQPARRVNVVLRCGAYLVHDDGFYRDISPFRDKAVRFRSAMVGWARVVSVPEPGVAILDGGRRDFPVDEGLPHPQRIGPRLGGPTTFLTGAQITAVDDQHSHLRFDPAMAAVGIGDVVRLGLSHPCTAMDKWNLIPVLADTDADQTITGFVHTFF